MDKAKTVLMVDDIEDSRNVLAKIFKNDINNECGVFNPKVLRKFEDAVNKIVKK